MKKSIIKAIAAFGLVILSVAAGFVLDKTDKPTDVYPNKNTEIFLYGEAHGYKKYYDIEFKEWRKFYEDGCRNLFVELPYYSAKLKESVRSRCFTVRTSVISLTPRVQDILNI